MNNFLISIIRNKYATSGPRSIIVHCILKKDGWTNYLIDDFTNSKGETNLFSDYEIGQLLGGN